MVFGTCRKELDTRAMGILAEAWEPSLWEAEAGDELKGSQNYTEYVSN